MARKSLFAILLGAAALAVPSAVADQGGIPHQGSNGQGRPAGQTQGAVQVHTQGKALAKGHAKTHAKAQAKANGHAMAKVQAHTQGKALAKGHAKAQTQTPTANTHAKAGKTTICHATGSATNPYVTITISNNAVPAHRRHQDGRDIIPAPAEGGCPTTATSAQQQPVTPPGQEQQAGAKEQEQAAAAPTTGASTTTSTPAGQTGVAGETTGSGGSPNNVSVLGASTSGSAPSASASPAATATQSSSSSKLPFTGTDAIIVAILGIALLLLGVTVRRAITTNRA